MVSELSGLPAISGLVRTAYHSVTYTVSSASLASPLLVMAMARGCASAGRGAASTSGPRRPVAAMVLLRSIVAVTVMAAGSTTVSVPSTQLET